MMAGDRLFGRSCIVDVGPPGGIGRSWSDLRVVFSVKRTLGRKPNEARIEINALTRDSSAWCRIRRHVVRLRAGYEVPQLLFLGDIDRAGRSDQPPESVTAIEARDGGRAFCEATVSKSYAGSVAVATVLGDLAAALGVPIGYVGTLPAATFDEGIVLAGPARDNLDRVALLAGAQWSIQEGVLQVVGDSEVLWQRGPLVSPATGLIGSPTPVSDQKRKGRIELTTLLAPTMKPGARFLLQSRDYNGLWKCEDVEHVGDTHGDDWYSRVVAREA